MCCFSVFFRVCLCFVLPLLIVHHRQGYAQDIKFTQFGINEGLSQNTVSAILQDEKGYMWFGTRDGLNRYDGYRFIVYKKNLRNENCLSANDIKAIVQDDSANLWIATWAGGLNKFNTRTEQFTNFRNRQGDPASIASDYIRSLFFDSKGQLWIGTGDSGLDRFDRRTGKFTHFRNDINDPGSLSDNTVTTILEDAGKNLWVGTINGGMNLFDPEAETFVRYVYDAENPGSLPNNNVQFIHEDKTHNLWVGTYGGGLVRLDRKTNTFHSFYNDQLMTEPAAKFMLSMAEDRDGNFWIGTENDGLKFFDRKKNLLKHYHHYDNDVSSVGSNSIMALYEDLKGNIWVGTFQGGINLINSDIGKFKHYKHRHDANSISSNTVTTIYEDSEAFIWIGTDGGGLNRFAPDDATFQHFSEGTGDNTLCSDFVLTVTEDIHHDLWIGTWGGGISVYNKKEKRFRHYNKANPASGGLSSDYAFYIFRDSRERIWIGTYGGGLNLYHPETDSFTAYQHNERDTTTISSDYVLTIFEDSRQRLWIGTDGGGLNYFDEENRKFYAYKYDNTGKHLSNNIINTICEDDKGALWLGTNFGLNKFDPEERAVTAVYFSEQGLPNDVITGIVKDHSDNLWIGTTKGLSRFNPKNSSFKNFTLSDGIQANDFRAQVIARNGMMYFGGKNGFNEFYPSKIEDLAFDPPIVFTSFQIFNKEVPVVPGHRSERSLLQSISETKEISITYEQSVISFEFASLNFTGNDKKEYMYFLEGFNKDWIYIGQKNSVTYTNLDPGTYTLKVRGLTNNGKWSDAVASLKINIAPPFWQTWWFKLCMIVAGLSAVSAVFYLRMASIKKRNRQLEHDVLERTSELREANNFLTESNEQITRQNKKLEEFNNEILRQSDEILHQQEKIVLQNQELEDAVTNLEKTNATKDRFFAILAHDLKNPVAALTGLSDALKNEFESLKKEDISGPISNIRQSAHAINILLNNLLDWGKSHSRNTPFSPVSINLYDLVLKNLGLIEQQLRSKMIEFNVTISEELTIFCDFHMIDTVFRNLLNNSIKFTPPYGKISLQGRMTDVSVEVILTDTGIGMSREQLSALFGLEKKHLSRGTNGETGTGLGLVITKEFLALNNSTIEVCSEPGTGSTFILRFPKSETGHPQRALLRTGTVAGASMKPYTIDKLPAEKVSKLKGKRILIVDDNKEIRAFLRLMLSGTCEIVEAENGLRGLEVARRVLPALIVSDMVMPVMDGLQFCEKIRSDHATSHIPVIMLTSQTEDIHHVSGYAAGADVYLTKPIKHDLFFQVILTLLSKQERIREKFARSAEMYPEDISLNKLDEAFVSKMIDYIEQHISDADVDHKKLCEVTAMSRSLLYEKCKAITGFGVHDFIKSIRLKKAARLLLERKLNVTQIAFEVGFTTPSHFTKSFVRQYGVSPTEYLNNYKRASPV